MTTIASVARQLRHGDARRRTHTVVAGKDRVTEQRPPLDALRVERGQLVVDVRRRTLERLIGRPHRISQRCLRTQVLGEPIVDLGLLLQRIRSGGRAAGADLWKLGRLLGVDYLLLLKVRRSGMRAHLYSVTRQRYSPDELVSGDQRVERLAGYIAAQVRSKPKKKPPAWRRRWWVWLIAAGLGAVTIGLALSASDDTKGALRIRVSR